MNEETQDLPKRLTPWGKMPHEAHWMWHSKSKKAKVQKSTSWGPELLSHLSLLSARKEILDALEFLLKKHYSNRQWMKTAKSVTKRNGHTINGIVQPDSSLRGGWQNPRIYSMQKLYPLFEKVGRTFQMVCDDSQYSDNLASCSVQYVVQSSDQG